MKTIFRNGTYERVSNEVADYEVRVGKAQYTSKSNWKINVRDINISEEKERGITITNKSDKLEKRLKLKEKQRS